MAARDTIGELVRYWPFLQSVVWSYIENGQQVFLVVRVDLLPGWAVDIFEEYEDVRWFTYTNPYLKQAYEFIFDSSYS